MQYERLIYFHAILPLLLQSPIPLKLHSFCGSSEAFTDFYGETGRMLNCLSDKRKKGSLHGGSIRSFIDIWTCCWRTWLSRSLSLAWAASVAANMQFSTFQVKIDLPKKWFRKERSAIKFVRSSCILGQSLKLVSN